jgi:hypothetical protein
MRGLVRGRSGGGRFALQGTRLRRRFGRWRRRLLRLWLNRQLRLLNLVYAGLAAFAFAAAPAAAMPLRLPLAVGRSLPQFGLGLRQLCRHA